MPRFVTRTERLNCPEGFGDATHSGTFRVTELSSGGVSVLHTESCDLEDKGAQCGRTCKLGTLASPLHHFEP